MEDTGTEGMSELAKLMSERTVWWVHHRTCLEQAKEWILVFSTAFIVKPNPFGNAKFPFGQISAQNVLLLIYSSLGEGREAPPSPPPSSPFGLKSKCQEQANITPTWRGYCEQVIFLSRMPWEWRHSCSGCYKTKCTFKPQTKNNSNQGWSTRGKRLSQVLRVRNKILRCTLLSMNDGSVSYPTP